MTSDAKHVTYTASGGNVVHTVSNYQELESIAVGIAATTPNTFGLTTAQLDLDNENREKDRVNQDHIKYLASTDWYVVRKADTGKAIPSDIVFKRQAARDAIQDLS